MALNAGVASGSAALVALLDAELLAVEPGGDFPHATPLRRFVWRPDRRETILDEFDKAVAALAAGTGAAETGASE